ncbi:MAG: glycoside hydrolase family 88 protein, partial [Sedimentisphaerales bacterium]|nr:glycoside hydrolase family 88 protein [Sedimentisphaerales bacterium]
MMSGKRYIWRLCVLGLLLAPVIELEAKAAVSVRAASENGNETIDWLKKVADWQLTQSSWDKSVSWERGALHAGLMACYEATKDEKYLDSCRQWSEKFNWQLGWDSHHADNMACAQTYLELYLLDEPDPFRYSDYKAQNDDLVATPVSFECNLAGGNETWWWCDALFMAPPAMVRMSRILQ